MKNNIITLLLLIASLMVTGCTKPIPSSQLDLNKTMRSKVHSLQEYTALPKAKRYKEFKGKFAIGYKEMLELASTQSFKKKKGMKVKVYKLDKTLNHITELLKGKTFQKEFPAIFSRYLDILVYSPHKMYVVTGGSFSKSLRVIDIWTDMELFEIKGDTLKVYFIDRASDTMYIPN